MVFSVKPVPDRLTEMFGSPCAGMMLKMLTGGAGAGFSAAGGFFAVIVLLFLEAAKAGQAARSAASVTSARCEKWRIEPRAMIRADQVRTVRQVLATDVSRPPQKMNYGAGDGEDGPVEGAHS